MPGLELLVALLNTPGHPGYSPGRLVAGFLLILLLYSGALLFTYWISKDE